MGKDSIMPKIEVAVFVSRGSRENSIKCRPYTIWFNSNWPGCNMVWVDAENGTEAKKRAVERIRKLYSIDPSSVKVAQR